MGAHLMTTTSKPREIAARMIRGFILGETDLLPVDRPKLIVDLAKTHARIAAAHIVHHSRRRRDSKTYTVPAAWWPMVREYDRTRGHL